LSKEEEEMKRNLKLYGKFAVLIVLVAVLSYSCVVLYGDEYVPSTETTVISTSGVIEYPEEPSGLVVFDGVELDGFN
jgi:hypothetical protein